MNQGNKELVGTEGEKPNGRLKMKNPMAQSAIEQLLVASRRVSTTDQTGESFLKQVKDNLREQYFAANGRCETLLIARILNGIDRIPIGKLKPAELETLIDSLQLLHQEEIEELEFCLISERLAKVGRSKVRDFINWLKA